MEERKSYYVMKNFIFCPNVPLISQMHILDEIEWRAIGDVYPEKKTAVISHVSVLYLYTKVMPEGGFSGCRKVC